jgi:hypothetical protein
MTRTVRFLAVMAVSAFMLAAPLAQAKGILYQGHYKHDPKIPERCRGPVSLVTDVGFEGVQTTAWNFGAIGGGGEGGRFDPRPVLSTKVELKEGCLNAHLSALVGSAQTYGTSPITLFQVTLTDPATGFGPAHMYGHFETPWSFYGPSVAIEAETDVDELGANFFQGVGYGPNDVPPGVYVVDVWWAGGLSGPGGAIGAAFVLKLYQ